MIAKNLQNGIEITIIGKLEKYLTKATKYDIILIEMMNKKDIDKNRFIIIFGRHSRYKGYKCISCTNLITSEHMDDGNKWIVSINNRRMEAVGCGKCF